MAKKTMAQDINRYETILPYTLFGSRISLSPEFARDLAGDAIKWRDCKAADQKAAKQLRLYRGLILVTLPLASLWLVDLFFELLAVAL